MPLWESSQPVACPAPGEQESSLCLALPCPACTAPPLPPHKPPREQSLNTQQCLIRRCQEVWWGTVTVVIQLQSSLPPSPCHSCPFLSTSYTMEILYTWFKTAKADRRYNFCALKHGAMFQSHILIQRFMAKLPSHKWHCVPLSSTASHCLTDVEICSDFCGYETGHYSRTGFS